MSSGLFQFLKSKVFFKNLLLLFILIIGCFFLLTSLLNGITHHGQNISVPDLRGLTISKLDSILVSHNFHYKVVDSLFDAERSPGAVLDQDPAPKSSVKEGRTIYLTINATQPPDVKMPDLVDVSYRQAEAMLQSFGLVAGDIIYRSDLAKNAVLDQLYNNKTIRPGTMIPKGSAIDLVLGDGLGDIEVPVPDLIGLSRDEAWSKLRRSSLALGIVNYDEDVDDTTSAKIYKQIPSSDAGTTLKQGAGVDIFLH
jgi:eukaryotic-like serine/threonine-protein kinase